MAQDRRGLGWGVIKNTERNSKGTRGYFEYSLKISCWKNNFYSDIVYTITFLSFKTHLGMSLLEWDNKYEVYVSDDCYLLLTDGIILLDIG